MSLLSRSVSAALAIAFAAAVSATAQQPKQPPAAGTKQAPAASSDVAVTVNYTGKVAVDAAHEILVFLFSTPDPMQGEPLGPPQIATKNGATLTFKNVGAGPVYVVAVFDEKGDYHGVGGPPPPGTPVAVYGKTATAPPTAVTPGPKGAIKFAFTEASRLK